MSGIMKICGVLLTCGLAGGMNADDGVTTGLNRFSASLYEQLAKNQTRNLAFSPFSIAEALSMTLAGAGGRTAAEISHILGQPAADPKYHAALAALVNQIVKAGNEGGNRLLDANGLWVQKDFPILPVFRDLLKANYQAPPSSVDFRAAIDQARAEINSWTSQHTEGKIRDLFPPGSLDNRTRLVLSSAIYFYGKWERAFRGADTRPEAFTPPSGVNVQTDFMHQTGKFGYAETAAGQTLEMRYAGSGLAFDVLLPKKGESVDGMDAGLEPARLAGWLGSLQNRTVQVAIPKFRVESGFPLAETLARIGMPTAFSGSADFSGIDDRHDLHLSTVVHKAYVDVSEEGTEAAAATGVAVSLVSAQIPQAAVTFRADRPFLFLIRDTHSGLILFAGRVLNPKG